MNRVRSYQSSAGAGVTRVKLPGGIRKRSLQMRVAIRKGGRLKNLSCLPSGRKDGVVRRLLLSDYAYSLPWWPMISSLLLKAKRSLLHSKSVTRTHIIWVVLLAWDYMAATLFSWADFAVGINITAGITILGDLTYSFEIIARFSMSVYNMTVTCIAGSIAG